MLKKNLFIPIEIKAREYVSNLLLVNASLEKNFRSYLGAKSAINKMIEYSKNTTGVYFSKSVLLENEYKQIKKKCDKITILDPQKES